MTKSKILKQIRLFCLACMGERGVEVLSCTASKCELYDFRQGKDPYPVKGRGFGAKNMLSASEKRGKNESRGPETFCL